MTEDKLFPRATTLPDHESAVRRMMADAHGTPYHPLRSLAEAQAAPDGAVIFEGDDGGQIYATCPAALVRCSEERLGALLRDLDAVCWCDLDGARVCYERLPRGSGVAGGMGGGRVTDDLWIHPEIEALELQVPLRAALTDAAPLQRSLYYELRPWTDVSIDGFIFGSIEHVSVEHGYAFVIAPDGARAGINWHIVRPERLASYKKSSEDARRYYTDSEYFEECRPPDDQLWGIWNVAFPFPIPIEEGVERREMARRNLVAVLPKLRARWEAWRSTE